MGRLCDADGIPLYYDCDEEGDLMSCCELETVDVEDLAFTIKTLADAACNLRKSGFEGSAYMINDLIQDIIPRA